MLKPNDTKHTENHWAAIGEERKLAGEVTCPRNALRSGEYDATMMRIFDPLADLVNALISEGATAIDFRWINIVDRETNPDGDLGYVRVVGIRKAKSENP